MKIIPPNRIVSSPPRRIGRLCGEGNFLKNNLISFISKVLRPIGVGDYALRSTNQHQLLITA